ncbi:MAG: hypothetical protein Q4D62_07770, partial [Planctomycetia bacterium]|nr:hypothetical protein [Planctomycetia bacterium]
RRCNEKKAKLPFNRERYRKRNIAERIFLKIKDLRRIATCCEKLSLHYLARIEIAFIKRWLKKHKNIGSTQPGVILYRINNHFTV